MQTRRAVSEWLYFRAYPKGGFHGLEYLIIQTLPQVLQCDGFDRWFFLRFIDVGGLHLRLRLQTTSAYVGELKRTAMPILQRGVERSDKVSRHTYRPTIVPPRDAAKVFTDDIVSSGRARVETASYEPEVEKFGRQGIEIAETLFEASSQLAMRVLTDEYNGTYDRKTLTPIFMRSVWEAFRDDQNDTDFWHDYVAYWLAAIPGMMQKWVPRFLAKARELTRRGMALYPEALDGDDQAHTNAARWQRAVGEAACAFQRVEPNFQDRRHKLAFHFIHLMNNRLGLMPIEEAYFATLIGQHEKGFRQYDLVTLGHDRS